MVSVAQHLRLAPRRTGYAASRVLQGVKVARMVFWVHEIPDPGISPPPAYSSAESGKMRGDGGSSPPSDTANPHGRLFSGMPGRHPGAGCRQRRATGDYLP